jgi:hypothetical protein
MSHFSRGSANMVDDGEIAQVRSLGEAGRDTARAAKSGQLSPRLSPSTGGVNLASYIIND